PGCAPPGPAGWVGATVGWTVSSGVVGVTAGGWLSGLGRVPVVVATATPPAAATASSAVTLTVNHLVSQDLTGGCGVGWRPAAWYAASAAGSRASSCGYAGAAAAVRSAPSGPRSGRTEG